MDGIKGGMPESGVAGFVFMFPGQGTQYVGMGKEVCDISPATARVWDCAGDLAGFDVRRLCGRGPMARLSATNYQQVAVTAVNLATLEALRETEIAPPAAVLGHSVGEYSALYAAGVLSLEDTFRAVAARGRIMQECAKATDGAMYAVKGVDHAELHAFLEGEGLADSVTIANDNSPTQQVLSGTRPALQVALGALLQRGFETVRLPVNGAWHSSLMEGGQVEFASVLDQLAFNPPRLPVYMNMCAAPVEDTAEMRRHLVAHLVSTVRWRETIRRLHGEGLHAFIEVGPRRVLSRLLGDFGDLSPTAVSVHAEELLGRPREVTAAAD